MGRKFSTTNQPQNRGKRKPRLYSACKRYGIDLGDGQPLTSSQIKDLLQTLINADMRQTAALNMMLNHDMKRIAEQIRNGEQPDLPDRGEVVEQIFTALSQGINRDAAKGRTDTVRWIIEMLYGKAMQPYEADITTTSACDLSALTTEELMQYNALLEKMRNGRKEQQ